MRLIIILVSVAVLSIIGFIFIKQHVLRVALGTLAASCLLLVCLLGIFIYDMTYKINPVDVSSSPDGAYELSFQQVGQPDWPFGYTHVRLVLQKGKEKVITKSLDIADDGGNASANNWNVKWKDDSVEVSIYGDEQFDVLYTLNFDGTDERKQLDTHYGETDDEFW